MPKQRFEHTIVINCSLHDVYEKEKDGWKMCGANGNVSYPNPTIYFKRPVEN